MSGPDQLVKDFHSGGIMSEDLKNFLLFDDSPRHLGQWDVSGSLSGGGLSSARLAEIMKKPFNTGQAAPPSTSEVTADVIQEKSSMSDRVFFERLSEQLAMDFANISATCVPVERIPEDPMAAARLLSRGYSFG
jgi:hypothetical protein